MANQLKRRWWKRYCGCNRVVVPADRPLAKRFSMDADTLQGDNSGAGPRISHATDVDIQTALIGLITATRDDQYIGLADCTMDQ